MTSHRQRETLDIGRWGRPPKPFVADERRWRRFRNAIYKRIYDLRGAEGIDTRTAPWQTFDTPLPVMLRSRPVPLRLMAAPTLDRDKRGRFLRRELAS